MSNQQSVSCSPDVYEFVSIHRHRQHKVLTEKCPACDCMRITKYSIKTGGVVSVDIIDPDVEDFHECEFAEEVSEMLWSVDK